MSHLLGLVLSEAETTNTGRHQKVVDARHVVTERLVVDDALVDGVTDLHLDEAASRDLRITSVEQQLLVANRIELGMVLLAGIDKVLNLSKCELAVLRESQRGTEFR